MANIVMITSEQAGDVKQIILDTIREKQGDKFFDFYLKNKLYAYLVQILPAFLAGKLVDRIMDTPNPENFLFELWLVNDRYMAVYKM